MPKSARPACSNAYDGTASAGICAPGTSALSDTHPSDGEAFELFRQYAALEETARADYGEIGGPIMRGETARSKTYTWLQDPWPWNYTEKEGK